MAGVKVACDFMRHEPTIRPSQAAGAVPQPATLLRLDFEEAFPAVDASLLMGKVEQALPRRT